MKIEKLIKLLRCPACKKHSALVYNNQTIICNSCGENIPFINHIIRFNDNIEKIIDNGSQKDIYDKNQWTAWRKKNFNYFKEKLKALKPKSIVLDMGAGYSQFSELLEQYEKYAVDIKPYYGIDIVADITKPLPFKDNCFDGIIMLNVLEHIQTPIFLMQEINRILKPSGVIILTVPFIIRIHQEPYDFLRYTEFMLEYILRETNFNNIEITQLGNTMDIYNQLYSSILKKVMGKQNNFIMNIILKILNKLKYIIMKTMLLLSHIKKEDFKNSGYVQGYGVFARK